MKHLKRFLTGNMADSEAATYWLVLFFGLSILFVIAFWQGV